MRYEKWQRQFRVPKKHLKQIMRWILTEARRRTQSFVRLPARECVRLEVIRNTDQNWSAYCDPDGPRKSRIRLNGRYDHTIGGLIDLAAHEAYPGHHTHGLAQETITPRGLRWWEAKTYFLYSPEALTSEGIAEAGIEIAFPPGPRSEVERRVLARLKKKCPDLNKNRRIREITRELGRSATHVAREYLDGRMSRTRAIAWLQQYALMPQERAAGACRRIGSLHRR